MAAGLLALALLALGVTVLIYMLFPVRPEPKSENDVASTRRLLTDAKAEKKRH